MSALFYISGGVAVISALLVVTRGNAMHALVNLIVTFLALACAFWTLGAPFAAALQIVIYAGAIMVLFVFAVMILNLNREEQRIEQSGISRLIWIIPVVLTMVLLVEFVIALTSGARASTGPAVLPAAMGRSLFTTYAIGVEIASVLLLAGLVAAFHFGVLPARLGGCDE